MEHTKRMVELKNGIAEISAILEAPDMSTDMEALLFRTGQMFAEAEYILSQKRAAVLNELLSKKPTMSANEQKVLVDARCAREAKLVRQIEQINKGLGIILAKSERYGYGNKR